MMNNFYLIDTEKSLVTIKISGDYSFDEFKPFFSSIFDDPRYEPGLNIFLCFHATRARNKWKNFLPFISKPIFQVI